MRARWIIATILVVPPAGSPLAQQSLGWCRPFRSNGRTGHSGSDCSFSRCRTHWASGRIARFAAIAPPSTRAAIHVLLTYAVETPILCPQ